MKDSGLDFHSRLKYKIHKLIVRVYKITEKFPRSELYGSVSQLRRAIVSIMLNYLEGFARFKPKVQVNFYEISYGSAKESKYLIFLANELGWVGKTDYQEILEEIDGVAGMIFSLIKGKRDASEE